jgi:L-rhamnose mutarotase
MSIKKQNIRNFSITKNIKEKNNFEVFNEMSTDEWNEIIEPELIKFLKDITTLV